MEELPVPIKINAEIKGSLGDATRLAGKIVDSIRNACGLLYEPIDTVRRAKAEAQAERIAIQNKLEIAEILQRAGERFISQQLRQQNNVDSIVAKAMSHANSGEVSETPCDPDWINEFMDCSKNVSNEQMQDILAKILAGEVSQPGKFSRRTVNLVRTISKCELHEFVLLCSFAWTLQSGATVIPRDPYDAPIDGSVDSPPYNAIQVCQSIGLIHDAASFTLPAGATLKFGRRSHSVAADKRLSITGYPFTTTGFELAEVLVISSAEDWYHYWLSHWKQSLTPHQDFPPARPQVPKKGLETLEDTAVKELIEQTIECINYWTGIVKPLTDDEPVARFPRYCWSQLQRSIADYKIVRGEVVCRDPSAAAALPEIDLSKE